MNKWMSYLTATLVPASLSTMLVASLHVAEAQADTADFTKLAKFGANPGELSASYYASADTNDSLLVLLHGCGQNSEQLAKQSGLYQQAKLHNFALLLPQQHKENNATTCFNWFSKADQDKDQGETLSIVNMIKATKKLTQSNKVFIVGLSAGGALTSSLMVHYPNMFEAGAVVAGIPYPCADNLIKAISCMKSGSTTDAKNLAKQINKTQVQWPKLTVITGDKDNIVNPKNAELMAQQWGYLTGQSKPSSLKIADVNASSFGESSELIVIPNMGHGLPINSELTAGGSAAPFVLESPFSAADYLVKKWIVE